MTLQPMNTDQLKLVEKEIKDSQINFEEEIKNLKEWIKQQPHLPKYEDSYIKLQNFLYGRKFSAERAKQTIDNYYSMKNVLPEYLKNRDPTHWTIQYTLKLSFFCILPKLTSEGYRVCLTGCHGPELDVKIAEDFYKVLIMYTEIVINEDFNRGIILIVDMEKFTFAHMMMTTLPMLKKLMMFVQKSFPCRIKGIVVINAPNFFDYLANLVKSTLSRKLQDRFHVYTKEETSSNIQRIIGKDVCPKDYGGDGPILEELTDEWRKKLIEYRDWFLREENNQSDESRRINNKFDPEQIFGMTGSFRKLTVD